MRSDFTFWTEEELMLVNNGSLTDSEVAEKTGRSIKSVKMKRYHLKKGVGMVRGAKVKTNGVGSRIQQLRIKKNLTREELGLAIGYGTEKSARNNVGQIETEVRKPTAEKLRAMAKIFGVTPAYLLTGKEEEPKKEVKPVSELPDPQPLKTAMANHEGYNDPTAAKAVAIVMNSKGSGNKVLPKHNPKPGEVYDVLNCSTPLLVLSVTGTNVLMTNLLVRKYEDVYTTSVIVNEKIWYINLSKVFTRKIIDLIDLVGNIDPNDYRQLMNRYSKNLGFGDEMAVTKPEKVVEEPDQVSIIFADSVNYYNEKNGTAFTIPEGVISLKTAIDISKQMSISMDDLIKDHTEDRVMDEIIKLQERIKELEASIGLTN